jgi:hypothetical protein
MIHKCSMKCLTIKYYYTCCFKINFQLLVWFHNLDSNNYFLFHKSNFKLHFTTWVLPITHTSSIQLDIFTSSAIPHLHNFFFQTTFSLCTTSCKTIVLIHITSITNTRLYTYTSTTPVLHFTSIS